MGGKTGKTHRDFRMRARHCFWGSDGQFRGNSVTNANFASIHILLRLLQNIREHNEVYKKSGAVHGCALCKGENIEVFIEDVGRHNATDAIAGHMLLEGISGNDKLFYTTGRLTSEMVIKVAQMGIPVLFSRAGITRMGMELSEKLGVTTIARAGGKHFLVYNGAETLVLDAKPPEKAGSRFDTSTNNSDEISLHERRRKAELNA